MDTKKTENLEQLVRELSARIQVLEQRAEIDKCAVCPFPIAGMARCLYEAAQKVRDARAKLAADKGDQPPDRPLPCDHDCWCVLTEQPSQEG